MDWHDWFKQYDRFPGLQARLQLVRREIAATLDECPPGPVQIVSVCAGDGRDLIGALQNHARRKDVLASLLDNHRESLDRGRAAAKTAGLERQLRFVLADATRAGNYSGIVPADLVILSGFLGHLRHEDVPGLIASLPMLCKTGGWVIWNRHLLIHDGSEQVCALRELLRQTKFEEVHFETTAADGFAVGRARFTGPVMPLDRNRVLFEFVGLDRLLSVPPPSLSGLPERTEKSAGANSIDPEQSIPARFEQIVARHSSRLAIGTGVWQPTYEELNAAANRLAYALSGGGGPGGRMALLMKTEGPLVAAVLAILKARGTAVVLNPTDPPARLSGILEHAEANLIITDLANRKLAEQIAKQSRNLVCFEEHTGGPAHNPALEIPPHALAFLLYTSGSTGQPKAIMQTHRNMLHNALRHTISMQLRAEDRIVLLASLSGGQGSATALFAMLNGATLYPFPTMERGVTGLADWMLEHKITVLVTSASVFRQFAKTLGDEVRFPDVRLVRFASEPATADDFAAYQRHFTDQCTLTNTFSATETGNITQHRFTRNDRVAAGRLPVGRPATGIEISLYDENGREVREGEAGEIAVKSRYLSPGYWRNEALTAQLFTPGRGPDDLRMFRGGDLGRRAADGALMFMGRKDAMVKVHGYRINVSEIENALASQPEVEQAVVCAREAPDNDLQLVAYVVLRAGCACPAQTLRRFLRSTLPGYMVPASFVFLDKFPLTPHGKVDRQLLPPPREEKNRVTRSTRPRDIVEATVSRIWESVLGVSPIGRRDDFFDLGGTSFQSAEILVRIEESLGASLPPSILTEHGTVEKLAMLLAGHVVMPSPSPLVLLRAGNSGRPLFLIHTGQGDVATYGLLARRLPGRPIYGLQSIGLQGESWPLMSVPAMAQRYLREIIAKDPTGPYLLAATCMGGMVAFELAQMLVRQGRQVGLLALLDVRYPLPSWRHHKLTERLYGPLRDPVRDAFRILRWSILRAAGLGRRTRWLPAYRSFVAHMNSRADRSYKPEFYPGTATLFITADTKFPREDLRLLMRHYVQEARVITVPGIRRGLFVPPAVDELARQLQACLDAVSASISK